MLPEREVVTGPLAYATPEAGASRPSGVQLVPVAEARTQTWEEFGKAIENAHNLVEGGAVHCQHCVRWRSVEYFEDLLPVRKWGQ